VASIDKLHNSAQKFIQKGQFDKAIGVYNKIVDLDPDIRNHQKLAELLGKADRKTEAVEEYKIIAEHYSSNSEFLKAIAVYKLMQKLNPEKPDIALSLASLNNRLGLRGNALAEYTAALTIFEKHKDNSKALKALEAMAELDNENPTTMLRLAEKYFLLDESDQAFDTFVKLAKLLKEQKNETVLNQVYERLEKHFPDRVEEAHAMVNTSTAPEAAEPEYGEQSFEFSGGDDTSYELNPAGTEGSNESGFSFSEDTNSNYLQSEQNDDAKWEYIDFDLGGGDSPAEIPTHADNTPEFDPLKDIDISHNLSTPASNVQDSLNNNKSSNEFVDLVGEFKALFNEIDFGTGETTLSGNTQTFNDSQQNLDTESHYSLGLAYRGMEFFQEAIDEFIIAAGSKKRWFECILLQSICYRDMNDLRRAEELFKTISKYPHITPDQYIGVIYELAICFELQEEKSKAAELYNKILSIKPDFRNVANRLAALK